MTVRGMVSDIGYNRMTDLTTAQILIPGDSTEMLERLQGELDIDLKKHRDRRSLNANALCWAAIGKLADALRTDKDSIYLEMLKRYGQGGVVNIPRGSEKAFKKQWKYCEPHEALPGDEWSVWYRFWVGSSHYNTQEMSVFIDGILSELKEIGIDFCDQETVWEAKRRWEVSSQRI